MRGRRRTRRTNSSSTSAATTTDGDGAGWSASRPGVASFRFWVMGRWLSVIRPYVSAFCALILVGFVGSDYGAPEAVHHLPDANHPLRKRLPDLVTQVALVSQQLETVVDLTCGLDADVQITGKLPACRSAAALYNVGHNRVRRPNQLRPGVAADG